MIHLTITTGHSSRTLRDDVDGSAIAWVADAVLARLVDQVERTGLTPLPRGIGWVSASRSGTALVCTAWAAIAGEDDLHGRPAPVATWGVAVDTPAAAGLWPVLVECERAAAALLGSLGQRPAMPPAPWVAVVLEVGAVIAPTSLEWVGDLERTTAWAWIDHLAAEAAR